MVCCLHVPILILIFPLIITPNAKVVALNAAGMVGTASSYYLPLDRVKRAVDLIRKGQPVGRGTLQVVTID